LLDFVKSYHKIMLKKGDLFVITSKKLYF